MVTLLAAGAGVLFTIALGLVGAEVRGWLPHVARRLVVSAANRLPDSERWSEEWESELLEYDDRPLSTLVYAIRIAMRSGRVQRELELPPARSTLDRPVLRLLIPFVSVFRLLRAAYEGFYLWAWEPALRGKRFNSRGLFWALVTSLSYGVLPLLAGGWQLFLAIAGVGGFQAALAHRLGDPSRLRRRA